MLAGALTATEWCGRILGVSRTVSAPLLTTWFVTGNNIGFVGDTARRVVPIYLDAKVEVPEARKFRHADLISYIRTNRPRLYVAALTVLRRFIVAGRPSHGMARLGSFEAWDDLVRGAVVCAMDADPLGDRDRIRETEDLDREMLRALLAAWAATFPNGRAVTARDVLRAASPTGMLYDALVGIFDDGKLPSAGLLGYRLRRWVGRITDGLQLQRTDKTRQGVLWRVTPAPGLTTKRDDGDDRDDDSVRPELDVGLDTVSGATAPFPSGVKDRRDRHHRHAAPASGPSAADGEGDE